MPLPTACWLEVLSHTHTHKRRSENRSNNKCAKRSSPRSACKDSDNSRTPQMAMTMQNADAMEPLQSVDESCLITILMPTQRRAAQRSGWRQRQHEGGHIPPRSSHRPSAAARKTRSPSPRRRAPGEPGISYRSVAPTDVHQLKHACEVESRGMNAAQNHGTSEGGLVARKLRLQQKLEYPAKCIALRARCGGLKPSCEIRTTQNKARDTRRSSMRAGKHEEARHLGLQENHLARLQKLPRQRHRNLHAVVLARTCVCSSALGWAPFSRVRNA